MTERRGFDEQLDDAKSDVVTLAARVCEQIARATQSILDGDLEAVDAVYAEHAEIGALHREIEERTYRIFALQQPIAIDDARLAVRGQTPRRGKFQLVRNDPANDSRQDAKGARIDFANLPFNAQCQLFVRSHFRPWRCQARSGTLRQNLAPR